MTISAYTPGLAIPNYKTTDYSNELELQIMAKKQGEYNTMMQRLNNLQSTALNISMLNSKGQEKLQGYNNQLNDMLSQDLGDLTDAKVQQKVAGFFNTISQDTDLKHRSQLSKHYETQNAGIEKMRNATDPSKSGYNKINEEVYKNWEGGLYDFMQADNVDDFDRKKAAYVPFKDIDQKLVNITKLLHEESTLTQAPIQNKQKIKVTVDGKEVEKEISMPSGYDLLESKKGVSASRIRGILSASLDADELAQFEILSKYRILQQGPQGMSNLYKSYSGWLTKEKQNTQNQLQLIRSYKDQYDPSKVDKTLSKADQEAKKIEYQLHQQQYAEVEKQLVDKLTQQTTENMTEAEWNKKGMYGVLPYINQLTVENYVNEMSDNLAWADEVKKVGMDEAYFANARINNMTDRLNFDKEMGRARLTLERLKGAGTGKLPETQWTDPGDTIKSEISVTKTWEDFITIEKDYSKKVLPIITGKKDGKYEIDPKQLVDPKWLQENGSNYEVQLWNVFKAKNYDTAFKDQDKKIPNIEAFEAFKQQINNGDSNDPMIHQIQTEYSKNKDVSEWLTGVAKETSTAVLNATDFKSVKVGNNPSLEAYSNGTSPEGELTFGVKDGKGGYKQLTWSEVKKEYENSSKDMPGGATTSAGGSDGWIGSLATTTQKQSTLLDNDPYFKELVGMAMGRESASLQTIHDIQMNKLPQFLQGNQQISLTDNAKESMLIHVNEATKLADDSKPLGISSKDIAQVSRPVGIGDAGYFMVTQDAAKSLNENGRKLVTVGGVIDKDIKANTWYKYKVPPVDQYDVMLNSMFDSKGVINREYNNYKIRINKVDGNPNTVYLTINGNGINETRSVPKTDIAKLLEATQQSIDSYSKAIK